MTADTVHNYLKTHKLGPKFADSTIPPAPSPPPSANGVHIGDRCEVDTAGAEGTQRGSVRFVGETEFGTGKNAGVWVGVEMDEPVGRNDGSVGGVKYFEAKPGYGLFVSLQMLFLWVQVGSDRVRAFCFGG